MKLVFKRIYIYLIFTIYFGFAVRCQNEGNDDSFHNYNLLKFVKKSVEHINTSQILKLLSEGDIDFVNEFEKFLQVSINSTLFNTLSEASSNKCAEDLIYVFENILSPGGWALKMLDSYGKPESGILAGNLKWLGQYDECVGIQAPYKESTKVGGFRGKYCTLQVPLKLGPVSLSISTALCLPNSCNPNGTFASILKSYNLNGTFSDLDEKFESAFENATLTCKATSSKLTTGAIVVICLLTLFALLAVVGSSITAFEHYIKIKISEDSDCGSNFPGKPVNSSGAEVSLGYNDNTILKGRKETTVLPACLNMCKPFFNCFCIFTNGEKILNTTSSEGQFPSLHGIRFLSMTWVILCHTYGSVVLIVNNGGEAFNLIDRWTFQIILNGFFSVDSFFVLSGFLVGYLYFRQAQKTEGKIPWLFFYIHRYIRLTPVYMIVLAFYTTISPFLGSGPLSPDYDVVQVCKDHWWWNALYINNFQRQFDQCMTWSWYLSNDMQFYVISPLFLITLWRWPKVGYSLLGLFFCIALTCNFVLTYEYNIIAGFESLIEQAKVDPTVLTGENDFFEKLYTKPYARIGSYLVGLVLAYYVHRRKRSESASLSWVTLSFGWIVASSIALTCQFGLYHQDPTTVEASFYNSFGRMGFALGLGWLIFVCVIGQGGAVNSILSWKAFIPLSRISYCAYLVHPIIQETYFSSMRTLFHFSHINVIMLYLGFLVMSYAVALVTSLLFESPIIRLERLITHRNKLAS